MGGGGGRKCENQRGADDADQGSLVSKYNRRRAEITNPNRTTDARSRIKASRTSTSGRYRPLRRAVIFVSNPSVRIGISGVWNGFFITASA